MPVPIAEDADQLTRELNGLADPLPPLAASTEAKDEAAFPTRQPPSLEQQLDAGRPARKPAPASAPRSSAADQVHSVKAGGRGYQVVVAGDYFSRAPDGKGHDLKEYEIPFNLPELKNAAGETALAIIIRLSRPEHSLLIRALKLKDPRFKAVHTYHVKSITALNGAPEPTSVQYMSMEALSDFARQRELGIDPADYWDVEHLRADVIYLVTNFADNRDARTGEPVSDKIGASGKGLGLRVSAIETVRKRHQERKDAKALLDMNPGLED